MKHQLLLMGKTKDSFLAEGIREYCSRLKHYTTVDLKTIKVKKIQGSDTTIVEKEGKLLLSHISSLTHLVALDSTGLSYTSTEFSQRITQWEQRNIRWVTYVIGGAFGLSSDVLSRADEKVSLSKMTFTHDMVRLFLLEQIYRAYTIKAGERYHK